MSQDNKQVFGKANEKFGFVKIGENENKEDRVMSFSNGGVYLGMKIITPYNEATKKYDAPIPRVTYIINGKFNNLPLTGKWWRAYADFVSKFADVMEGLDLEKATVIDDVARAKQLMVPFREQ